MKRKSDPGWLRKTLKQVRSPLPGRYIKSNQNWVDDTRDGFFRLASEWRQMRDEHDKLVQLVKAAKTELVEHMSPAHVKAAADLATASTKIRDLEQDAEASEAALQTLRNTPSGRSLATH